MPFAVIGGQHPRWCVAGPDSNSDYESGPVTVADLNCHYEQDVAVWKLGIMAVRVYFLVP